MLHYKRPNQYAVAAVCLIILLTSCKTYYKAIQTPVDNSNQKATLIDSLNQQSRYFILQKGSQAFHMEDINLNADRKAIDCLLDTITHYHKLYLSNKNTDKLIYYKNDPLSSSVLSEVHIYIRSDTAAVLGQYTLPLNEVQKIEVIEKDKKQTTTSSVIGWTSLAAGLALLIYISTIHVSFF